MIRRKFAALGAAALAVVALAGPASALSTVNDPVASCTNRTAVTWNNFDDPYRSGTQTMGTLKLYHGTCNGSWQGVWAEANRIGGGALKVGVEVYNSSGGDYSLTKTGQSVATYGSGGTVTYTYVVSPALSTAGYPGQVVSVWNPSDGRLLSRVFTN